MKVSIPVKYVVPDLEKKCRNYDRARTALFCTFFLFFPAIILMIILPKWAQYHRLNNFVKSVKTQDKVLLLPYLGYIQNSKEIAQALIDTGNLADYHLVAGIMLVKNGVEVSEAEAIAEYSAMFNPQAAAVMEKAPDVPLVKTAPVRLPAEEQAVCPFCGETLQDKEARFCPYCGRKF